MPDVNEFVWIKDLANVGALGVVAFGAHYLLSKTWPSLVEKFTIELKDQRTLHMKAMEDRNSQFLSVLENQRRDFLAELTAERDSNVKEHERTIAIFREQQKELLTMRCLNNACMTRVNPPTETNKIVAK